MKSRQQQQQLFQHLRARLLRSSSVWYLLLLISNYYFTWSEVEARPLVRHIRSTHEFDRLLQKHATETGLPVVVDFYSDGCGPCRMIAPVFQQVAKEYANKAVFVKVDVNALYELSSRYQVRSMPTFHFMYNGKTNFQFSGAGEQQLRHYTKDIVDVSNSENVLLSKEILIEFYKDVDMSKNIKDIESVYQKCADFNKGKYNDKKECLGNAATKLVKSLKTKYGKGPKVDVRFKPDMMNDETGKEKGETERDETSSKKKSSSSPNSSSSPTPPIKANLHLATLQELLDEIEKRKDEQEDQMVEEESDDTDEFAHSWSPGAFPERVTIIGGGPAGMSAAIYCARAGLTPVVIAPPMGGQLQGKGVDVENYPGLTNMTGPGVVASMRNQAAMYGAVFEVDIVTHIDVSNRPFKVYTNSSIISTHSIIVATGAESRWLNVSGEYELRGNGVSSCATCDGAAFYKKDVVVVGGGDSAMEDALVLARTSKSVIIIHRRDEFRASKVLAKRVLEHPNIKVIWNATVTEILGEIVPTRDDGDVGEDSFTDSSDTGKKIVSGILLRVNQDTELITLKCDAVFVAIGHDPNTSFLKDIVEFDNGHPGYIKTIGKSTKTSIPGIFAAGDVSDAIYRQAITSAGSGAAAALDTERWLSENNLGNEAAEFEAELLAEMLANTRQSPAYEYNVYEESASFVKGTKESARGEL